MSHPLRAFALASLTPVGLLVLAAWLGGWFVVAALLYVTIFAFCLDQIIAYVTPPRDPAQEFPAGEALSVTLAFSHFVLLGLVVWALSRHPAQEAGLGLGEKLALFVAAGQFFGQVSNSNAHELIHRSRRFLHRLGMWVYISLLFGHHTSAHPKVHHRHVASPNDPNSARAGESFYAFAPRAWLGSFQRGYAIESADRAHAGKSSLHPYVTYIVGAFAVLVLAWVIGEFGGVIALLALAAYAQIQLLLSDYVQHYGLVRATGPDGKRAPVGDQHSWNAAHWFTANLMLNAPRHSDHHAHPARPFPALALPAASEAPRLPYSLPVMATLALFPTLWHRVMSRELSRWAALQAKRNGQ